MKTIREQFEEIWPVPDRIQWSEESCEYEPPRYMSEHEWDHLCYLASEHNARLDTFTRCQETTAIYSGIVDDMISEMELINDVSTDLRAVGIAREAIGRAKQKMGIIK